MEGFILKLLRFGTQIARPLQQRRMPVRYRLLTAFLCASAFLYADSFTINLNAEFSGATPPASATTPWVTATFSDVVGGGVELVITALNLTGSEFISAFYFNFDPARNAAGFLPDTPSTGSQTSWDLLSGGNQCCKADGDGDFDFRVAFPTDAASGFTAGETFVASWAAATGLTAADFDYISVNGPPGKDGFGAAAHVQSIGADGKGSGWIGGHHVDPIPEPVSIFLLGTALAGVCLSMRKTRR